MTPRASKDKLPPTLGLAVWWARPWPPKPHPPRNRGEGTGVDGLMPVGQEDTPSS